MTAAGIGTGIHYPIPLHLQEAYRHLGFQKEDFPVSEGIAEQLLSLPMYPQLEIDQQRAIVQEIREFLLNTPDDQPHRGTDLDQVTNRLNAEC